MANEMPGYPVSYRDLMREGFVPLELAIVRHNVTLPNGWGTDWNTVGDVPAAPGHYLFTVGEDDVTHYVAYVGMTGNLWMVTKGRLPSGAARGGQRYGRPQYAGPTRKRVNVEVTRQLNQGRRVIHWVRPICMDARGKIPVRPVLRLEEERLIERWELRSRGWNRG